MLTHSNLIETCAFMMFVLWLSPNTHQPNVDVQLRKVTKEHPHTLVLIQILVMVRTTLRYVTRLIHATLLRFHTI